MPFESSCLPRLVRVDGEAKRVDPPTVGQAIELFYVSRHMDPENEDELRELRNIILSLPWETESLRSEIKAAFRNNPAAVLQNCIDVIQGNFDPKELERSIRGAETTEEASEKNPSTTNWRYLLVETCRILNLDVYRVWEEYPFTFFMELVVEARAHKYRKRLEDVRVTSAGFGGIDEDTISEWQDMAMSTIRPSEQKESDEDQINPEDERKQLLQRYGL